MLVIFVIYAECYIVVLGMVVGMDVSIIVMNRLFKIGWLYRLSKRFEVIRRMN